MGGHVERIGEMRSSYKILVEDMKGDLGIDYRIILNGS
jgi:hypothetical protein